MRVVRRARPEDAKGIHEAHMRSIQEVCAKDHSAEEIKAWGQRPFHEESRVRAIQSQFVWVVANGETIEGYGHFGVENKDQGSVSHIYGLYLVPEAMGQGFGKKIVQCILEETKKISIRKVILESTLTAHSFYQSLGFQDSGPQKTISLGGLEIRCFPMFLSLDEN